MSGVERGLSPPARGNRGISDGGATTRGHIDWEHSRVHADPSRLKSWVNTKLGETWEERAAQDVDSATLRQRVESWGQEAPQGVAVITAGIDTQDTWLTPQMVDDFLSSAEMPKGERTRKDYRTWALRFASEFADAPADMFEERESRVAVNDWRAKWRHAPKHYDYAGTVAARVPNWAVEQGKIREHHCERFRKVYKADRADIVWTPTDREAIDATAPQWVRRILTAACETGLRPGDLIRLSWSHIENTADGRRIKVRTNKRKRTAFIAVTPAMAELLDATPRDRLLILVNAERAALWPSIAPQRACGSGGTRLNYPATCAFRTHAERPPRGF